jgi:hypothetical protein
LTTTYIRVFLAMNDHMFYGDQRTHGKQNYQGYLGVPMGGRLIFGLPGSRVIPTIYPECKFRNGWAKPTHRVILCLHLCDLSWMGKQGLKGL